MHSAGRVSGGASPRVVVTTIPSPVGPLTLGSVTRAGAASLCLCEFGHRAPRAAGELGGLVGAGPIEVAESTAACPVLALVAAELAGYFAGSLREFSVPVTLPGTPFRRRVWRELMRIGYGTTISYGELARRVGSPGAARAVGAANGANRVAIIVPCHRVIDAAGRLHGYGGGVEVKRRLLELEGALDPSPLF